MVSHLHREIPRVQNLQDISRLSMIWNQLITSLASNYSHLGRKRTIFTGYRVGNRVCKIQKQLKTHLISRAQMWVVSTQTCIEERDTKVSYLQTREYWKSRKISLPRKITRKTTLHGNTHYVSTLFLNVYVKPEDTQNDFQAVPFSGLVDSLNRIAQMLFCNTSSDLAAGAH